MVTADAQFGALDFLLAPNASEPLVGIALTITVAIIGGFMALFLIASLIARVYRK